MLTTQCSAGCGHCPFSSEMMEKLHLDLNSVLKFIDKNKSQQLTLSGGEPFEYRFISDLLMNLQSRSIRFRVATGGHIDLNPWISLLKAQIGFLGLSMGTDILIQTESIPQKRKWHQNLRLLASEKIPFSFTLTLLSESQTSIFEDELSKTDYMPEFIYCRISPQVSVQAQKDFFAKISSYWNCPVLIEPLSPIRPDLKP